QISSGHYANYSDYILDLIRRDQQQNLLMQAFIEGENSGDAVEWDPDVFMERIRSKTKGCEEK
ncbi:MAG: type II toxin-antitoxin system ParD family antitoxin, partial [Serratia liquefaciens]|nr:type II toxin-antitoxin system ParD family antitoxin [Serratia liquefaciens]